MADEKSFIIAYCRPCQAPRYRSIKPLGRKDESRPELFKALDPGAPEPTEGPATCYLCNDRLVLMAETKLPPLTKSEPVRREEPASTELFQDADTDPVAPTLKERLRTVPRADTVEVLFELQTGEELRISHDTPECFLIITNKRVVRVNKG